MTERPYIIINVAQSLNGFISGSSGRRVTISSRMDLFRVHRLRSSVDAIMVGANTIINDNPRLMVDRTIVDSNQLPIRIVLDRNGRCGADSRVFEGNARTVVYTSNSKVLFPTAEVRLRDKSKLDVSHILHELQSEGVERILIEGGKQTITQFIEAGLIDEFYVYVGDIILEDDGTRLFQSGAEIRNVIKELEPMDRGVLISLDPYNLQRSWRTQAKDT